MRAISIRQPFACLTASGIRDLDVSNRDTKYRGRVLIHASSRRVGKDFGKEMSADQYCRLRNAQALGVIPYDEEMPLSSIIGFADLVDCTTEPTDSCWDPGNGIRWVLRNPRIFDTPIMGIKGKQGLFDLPDLTEAMLPSHHEPVRMWSEYHDGIVSISMTDEEIDRQLDFWPISLCICRDGLTGPLMEGKHPKPISMINLVSKTRTVTYKVKDVRRWEDKVFSQPLSYLSIELDLKRIMAIDK